MLITRVVSLFLWGLSLFASGCSNYATDIVAGRRFERSKEFYVVHQPRDTTSITLFGIDSSRTGTRQPQDQNWSGRRIRQIRL